MFGGDPNQMLFQLENYYRDGRLELAEVLSTQLTESLSAIKSRNQDQQLMLVKSLFFSLADFLQARGKTKNASKSIKQLVKERRSMLKSFPETRQCLRTC